VSLIFKGVMMKSIFIVLVTLFSTLYATTFATELPIPKLASYKIVRGVKVFDMYIREGLTEFFAGYKTKTYGINASVLGETIRIHNGDKVEIRYHNRLHEPTTMHGHGMHIPTMMDGGPINKIQPNTTWSAKYTVKQEASTNWYHPHLMGKTAEHVYMGLAGLIIVDDNVSDNLIIPKQYGYDDIPIILQDKRFDSNKQIVYAPSPREVRMGYKSNTMLVNGAITPYFKAPSKRVRLRLLNGSNGRLYKIAFKNGKSFKQIATDGGFLEHPVLSNSILLSPGERAEIVVNFSNDYGKSFILTDLNSGLELMKIDVSKVGTIQGEVPDNLTTLEKLNPNTAVKVRKFILGMTRVNGKMHMSINGKVMNMNRLDELVPVNQIEIWEITNRMNMEHNFHIHATHFYPLTRDGSATKILPNERGYKDTIRVGPRQTVRFIVKMTDYIDKHHGYMYHCHYLEHEDDGMMGQFATVQNSYNPVPDYDHDGVDDISDNDDDNDGVIDSKDAFPHNPRESVDTDGDGIGNNADSDDDGDGFSDKEEIAKGTNPLDPNSHPPYKYVPILVNDGLMIIVPTH